MTVTQTTRVNSWFVLPAVCLLLVFGAASLSAQTHCEEGDRCDRDGDTYPKNLNGRCADCDLYNGEIDCDDSFYDPENLCEYGAIAEFDALLTAGAFVFEDDAEPGVSITMPMYLEPETGVLRSGLAAQMSWDGAESRGLGWLWDSVFEATCPELYAAGGEVQVIREDADRWGINPIGDVRVILDNIRVFDAQKEWALVVQLVGDGTSLDPFLPAPGQTSTFTMDRMVLWGEHLRGGQGGKAKCGRNWVDLEFPSILEITAAPAP